jgi:tetratricopeptide (TPR) repeat protein
MTRKSGFAFCLISLIVMPFHAHALTFESQTQLSASYSDEAQGLIHAAVEKMAMVFKAEPGDYLVNLRLGWLFFLEKKYKNSLDHYTRAAYQAPYSVEPLLGLSQTLLAAEEYARALETCKLILKLDPGSYLGHQRTVQAQIKLKQFANAVDTSTQALLTYPTDPVLLEQRGFALRELGRDEEAVKTLTYLLLVSPHNAYARFVVDSPRRAVASKPSPVPAP